MKNGGLHCCRLHPSHHIEDFAVFATVFTVSHHRFGTVLLLNRFAALKKHRQVATGTRYHCESIEEQGVQGDEGWEEHGHATIAADDESDDATSVGRRRYLAVVQQR